MSLFSEGELSFDAAQSPPEASDTPGSDASASATVGSASAGAPPVARRRFRHIARDQPMFALVDVERMLDESHPAREIARQCEWEPGFGWLTGLRKVNHHTLSDFRVKRVNQMEKHGRAVSIRLEDDRVDAFLARMETGEAKAIYKKRAPLAEFPNAWLKTKRNGARVR
ncbi:MAG: hypothetical protein IT169_17980 [Bryobacterales bacterium]|nr:hypothetical protein [Bryobacterales bacterium]